LHVPQPAIWPGQVKLDGGPQISGHPGPESIR
jgi:hypothetical protein